MSWLRKIFKHHFVEVDDLFVHYYVVQLYANGNQARWYEHSRVVLICDCGCEEVRLGRFTKHHAPWNDTNSEHRILGYYRRD